MSLQVFAQENIERGFCAQVFLHWIHRLWHKLMGKTSFTLGEKGKYNLDREKEIEKKKKRHDRKEYTKFKGENKSSSQWPMQMRCNRQASLLDHSTL